MKNNNYLKIVSVFWIMIVSAISVEAVVFECKMRFSKLQQYNVTPQLLSPRALIPHSLEGRIRKTKESFRKGTNSNSECNTSTSLCASFEKNTTQEGVSAWMGFDLKTDTEQYFIATYGQKANHLGNGVYSTKKWNKQHFWLNIGEKSVPLAIQTRYIGIDDESANEWYSVDYIGFRKTNSGIDYSKYPDNLSTSALILLVNPKTNEVIEYYLEHYDENNEYTGDYTIEIGDEIESYFIGFKKSEGDIAYLFSVEDIAKVTQTITFTYKEQYPGKDFNCTNCGELNFSKSEFKYIFEAYGETRSNFTEPKPLVAKNSTSANNSSTTKSVPLSGFWILFILTIFIAMINLKKGYTHV